MGVGEAIALVVGCYIVYNYIRGGNVSDVEPTSQTEKDVNRLTQIAEYDRWEDAGRANKETSTKPDK